MPVVVSWLPKFAAFDNAGNPLVGGRLRTFLGGTTTPAAVYTSSAGTTPQTNPIILNSRGEADVYPVAGQAYKYQLEDAQGAVIWTIDNVVVGGAGTGSMGGPVSNLQLISAASTPTALIAHTVVTVTQQSYLIVQVGLEAMTTAAPYTTAGASPRTQARLYENAIAVDAFFLTPNGTRVAQSFVRGPLAPGTYDYSVQFLSAYNNLVDSGQASITVLPVRA